MEKLENEKTFKDLNDIGNYLSNMCALSCPTLPDPTACSPLGSSVHGILQARVVKWVAMPSSPGFSQPRDWTHIPYIFCIGILGYNSFNY